MDDFVDNVTSGVRSHGNQSAYYFHRRPFFEAIDLYVTPIWYILGIPGNALACAVWIQRTMRPSSGCFLAALAMDEAIFLILQIFFELQMKWNVALLNIRGVCELFPALFLTSQHLSPLLVFGFTVERYVSVCHPFHRDRLCTTRRALVSIAATVISSLAINSTQGYFFRYDPTTNVCGIRDGVLSGQGSFWSVYSWITELVVFGAVPLAILVLNLFVIRERKRLTISEKRLVLHHPLGQRGTSARSKSSATTLTLLAVSFFLIVTTLPVTLIYVLYVTFKEGEPGMTDEEMRTDAIWIRHRVYLEIKAVVEEFGLSHYASNFYIYLFTGRIFRRELRRILASVVCRKRRNRWAEVENKSEKQMRCGRSKASNNASTNSASVL